MSISEYHRPKDLKEALGLLGRESPITVPLGGGTRIDRRAENDLAVVDLQSLGLNKIEQAGSKITIGACATLQQILDDPMIPSELKAAIHMEASANQQQMATIAGRLVSADGRSPLATILLAMDSELTWEPGSVKINLGDWLPMRSAGKAKPGKQPGLLITSVGWPAGINVVFQRVTRTPMDQTIVCVGVAGWRSGRRRVAVGGFGSAPIIAMDGPEAVGAEEAVRDALSQSGDAWASLEYRQEAAVVLTKRCIEELARKLPVRNEL